MRRLLLVVVSMGVMALAAACGGSSEAPDRVPVASADSSPQAQQSKAFSKGEIDDLLKQVQGDVKKYTWAAGCIWRDDGTAESDESSLVFSYLGLASDGEMPSGYAMGALGYVSDKVFIATIHKSDYKTNPTANVSELVKVEGDGFVCYQPG